jgi:hypothetical protein
MSANPPEVDLSTWVDLAGLPAPVAANIRQLVESLRNAGNAEAATKPKRSIEGVYAHLMQGPGWTAEQFEEARREMNAEWEASLNAKFGVE